MANSSSTRNRHLRSSRSLCTSDTWTSTRKSCSNATPRRWASSRSRATTCSRARASSPKAFRWSRPICSAFRWPTLVSSMRVVYSSWLISSDCMISPFPLDVFFRCDRSRGGYLATRLLGIAALRMLVLEISLPRSLFAFHLKTSISMDCYYSNFFVSFWWAN